MTTAQCLNCGREFKGPESSVFLQCPHCVASDEQAFSRRSQMMAYLSGWKAGAGGGTVFEDHGTSKDYTEGVRAGAKARQNVVSWAVAHYNSQA